MPQIVLCPTAVQLKLTNVNDKEKMPSKGCFRVSFHFVEKSTLLVAVLKSSLLFLLIHQPLFNIHFTAPLLCFIKSTKIMNDLCLEKHKNTSTRSSRTVTWWRSSRFTHNDCRFSSVQDGSKHSALISKITTYFPSLLPPFLFINSSFKWRF